MEYVKQKWILLFSMVDFEILVLIVINAGPFEPKSKWRKCFQFLTWSVPDIVLLFEWTGFLFFLLINSVKKENTWLKMFFTMNLHVVSSVFLYLFHTINYHVPEHHQTKNLHDESLFSLPKFCLLHLAFHFHHYYFCDFLILIQTRQIFLLCQLNVSISIFQKLASFKLLKCEFSPTYAQSFDVQTLSPSFSIWVPFPYVFFNTRKTCLT